MGFWRTCKCSCESDNLPLGNFSIVTNIRQKVRVMNWMRASPPRERREKLEDACVCPTGKLSDQDPF